MTGGTALSLAAVPTLASLALRGLADPKRRRAAREKVMPPRWRGAALATLAVTGLFVALTAGAVAFLIWSAAATLLGWCVTEGLAGLPPLLRLKIDRLVKLTSVADLRRGLSLDAVSALRPLSSRARLAMRACLASPRERGTAIATACGLVALLAALSARTIASEALGATGRLVGLQALTVFDGTADARDRVRPCLRVIDAVPDAGILRDLLSDRATSIPVASGNAGTDLQQCILSHNGEGARVEREAETLRFTLAPEVVGAIHADVVKLLLLFETMAELGSETPTARDLICRHVFSAEAEGARGFVAILQRDRTYAKAGDLLLRLAALDGPDGTFAPGNTCP